MRGVVAQPGNPKPTAATPAHLMNALRLWASGLLSAPGKSMAQYWQSIAANSSRVNRLRHRAKLQ
jgi:hypothetical protein